ncbi:MAG: aldo/keto reductase [Acidobacteria bacterium]|nr:aldo/keto reductase [Acidobacteriota bacterium]
MPPPRLCVSATYRPGVRTLCRALDEGVNCFFGFPIDTQFTAFARSLTADQRDRVTLATGGANWIVGHAPFRRALDNALRRLRTDRLDIFFYLGLLSANHFPASIQDELRTLRATGKVRSLGVSAHDTAFAALLAAQGFPDVLMIRYNAARREADSVLFPNLPPNPPRLFAFTATYWTRLLRRLTAAQCYRFVLSNPAVDTVLTSPRSEAELVTTIRAIEQGPLDDEELQWIRRTGDEIRAASPWFLD